MELLVLAKASLVDLAFVTGVAFVASIVGGVSGYGTGLILPIVLAPIVGIANVVPVMAIGMTVTNASRIVAFWADVRWIHVQRALLPGTMLCVAGAFGYTLLSARWIAIVLGAFLMVSIPLRRALLRANRRLGPIGERVAGSGFGVLNGGMTGTGPILSCILMAAGVHGAALIGTDAVISTATGLTKIAVFGGAARFDTELVLFGLLIGAATVPGAFIARRLLDRLPAARHVLLMEGIVLIGALLLLLRGLTGK